MWSSQKNWQQWKVSELQLPKLSQNQMYTEAVLPTTLQSWLETHTFAPLHCTCHHITQHQWTQPRCYAVLDNCTGSFLHQSTMALFQKTKTLVFFYYHFPAYKHQISVSLDCIVLEFDFFKVLLELLTRVSFFKKGDLANFGFWWGQNFQLFLQWP